MALQIDTPTVYGVNALYWSVDLTDIDYKASVANVTVGGYVTSAAKQATAQPLVLRRYKRAVANPDAVTRTNIYTYLKTLPEYSGAVDVADV